MSTAYSVRAVMSPISIKPPPMRLPPSQRMATTQRFRKKMARLSSTKNRVLAWMAAWA